MRELKTFTDAEGTKVKIGEVVSAIGTHENYFPSIYIVKGIRRVQREIEIKLFDNVTQFYFYLGGKDLISEEF